MGQQQEQLQRLKSEEQVALLLSLTLRRMEQEQVGFHLLLRCYQEECPPCLLFPCVCLPLEALVVAVEEVLLEVMEVVVKLLAQEQVEVELAWACHLVDVFSGPLRLGLS